MIVATLGDTAILNQNKTAFLCSRKISAGAVLRCYDWAIQQREAGRCIISGFHSQIEKDTLHYLLKGNQPIIIALARGMKKNIEPEFVKPIEQGRLLIIAPFKSEIIRVTEQTAFIRNKYMIEIADAITVGYVRSGGQLDALLKNNKKPVDYLFK